MKRNEVGSTLIWAIVVVMVLFVSVGAALALSSTYYQRAIQSNDERQAYLSAKGIIEDMVNNIIVNEPAHLALFEDLKENKKTFLSIPIDANLGVVPFQSSYIECLPKEDKNGKIKISITTKVNDASYTLNADLYKGRVESADVWQLYRYYQVETEEIATNGSYGGDLLYEMKTLGNCWMNSNKKDVVDACLVDEMKKDPTGYANVKAKVPSYEPYKNNDLMRTYFYNREDPSGWEIFDKEQITNVELGKQLKAGEYYIQPFFPKTDFAAFIVYAKFQSTNVFAGGWGNAQLFYNEGHWYYVNNVTYTDFINGATDKPSTSGVMLSNFESDTKAPNNSSAEKWARFVKAYLTPQNRLD